MTNNQATPGPLGLASRDTVRIVLRIGGWITSALCLYGCSTPQPITSMLSNETPPPAITDVSASPAEKVSVPVPKGKAIELVSEENNIFFPSGSAEVDDSGKEKLRRHADRLKLDHKALVSLVGYADDQGSRNYNLAITEERLMAVEKLLRTYGVAARQIRRIRIDGKKNQTACTTNECRQQMRRVELIYSP